MAENITLALNYTQETRDESVAAKAKTSVQVAKKSYGLAMPVCCRSVQAEYGDFAILKLFMEACWATKLILEKGATG